MCGRPFLDLFFVVESSEWPLLLMLVLIILLWYRHPNIVHTEHWVEIVWLLDWGLCRLLYGLLRRAYILANHLLTWSCCGGICSRPDRLSDEKGWIKLREGHQLIIILILWSSDGILVVRGSIRAWFWNYTRLATLNYFTIVLRTIAHSLFFNIIFCGQHMLCIHQILAL